MLQRLGIRGKVLAVVAVPILVLIVAAGVITLGSVQDLNSARNAEDLIDTLGRARDLQEDLQTERELASHFVHTVQDNQGKLRSAISLTEQALDEIAERIAEEELENGEEIQAAVDDAVRRSGEQVLVAERALELGPPTDESGGWVVFPSEDDIAAMQQRYAAAVDEVNAVLDMVPEESTVDVPLNALSFRVNAESLISTDLFTAPLEFQEPMATATSRVDNGVASLVGSTDTLSDTEENERAVASLLAGEQAISQLDDVRANVRSVTTGPATVTTYYTDLIGTIVTAADDVAVGMADRGMVSAVQAYGDLDALVENIKYEDVVLERLIRAGSFLPGEPGHVRTFTTQTDLSLADAQNSTAASPDLPEVPPFGASASDSVTDTNSFESVRTQVLTGLDSSLFTAGTASWSEQVAEELAAYEPLREEVWESIETEAANNSQAALVQTVLTAIAVAAVVIVSIVVALVIARTIIGPLRRLTTTATAVRQELPRLVERVAIPGESIDVTEVQVPVESRDEIGRLAEAFNGVNAATLDIAGEQAALRGSISEMFVNVARRDQVLLNRQLSSIDEMERSEDNPETLTKLFALDHLATRMRRNSESLLVLAGIDTGRRLRRPMPLSDVIRTASSEIELYERVQLELDVDPKMLGHSALTAAHLIAELLENATVFSDPGTSVVVRTVEREDEYLVEVEDSGIGMTAKELEDANARINSTSASEILGAQRLGLFVVGRIARRVGATVTIDSEEGKGTIATVAVPRSSFAAGESAPTTGASTSTVDEATHAPVALTKHNTADEITESPARAPSSVEAYTPTSIEGGASLTGRDGAEGAPNAQSSIDDLIASDAANAPEAEAADPGALTEGSSAVGLPTRRRRQAPDAADAAAEQSSIVGLPARATDEQLSALAQEGAGGFTPAVAASEITPQSAQERASMFRGFRARGGDEPEAPAASNVQDAPQQVTDDNQGVPVDSAGASALPTRTPAPAPEPQAQAEPTERTSTRDAGMAAAGAAGAAAFFARRARDEASAPEATPAPEAAPAQQAPSVASAAQDSIEVPNLEAPTDAAASESAPGAFAPSESAPSIPEFSLSAASSPAPASAPEPSESAPAGAAEPEEPAMPVFRMPKLEVDPADSTDQFAGAASTEGQPIPALEDDAADQAQDQAQAPPFESSPYSVPVLEEDDAAVQSAPTEQSASEPGTDSAPGTPYGGVEQVSLESQEPQFDPQPAPDYLSAPQEQQYDQQQPVYGEQQDYDQPATLAEEEPAAPWLADGPADQQQEVAPAAEPEPTFASEPAVPQQAPSGTSERDERANANLDALLQTAADTDTQERPGFFSRLFGRGRNNDPDAAGAAATQWADPVPESAAPASAPSAPMSFAPVAESAPGVAATQPAFSAPSASEPAAQPPASESAPAAPASAPSWEAAPQGFAPEPASQPGATEPPAAREWQSQPSAPTPLRTSLHAPAPWEQSQAPSQPHSQPSTQEFTPASQDTAGQPGMFTPDELADATGWQAAGASALQAAQPDVATSYQPVIQPEDAEDGGDADVTSAVFSEFSSLAAERPKVEKTRAGLEKRRPSNAKPVEVKPIEDNVEIAPKKRDADEVRNRFSSFYSGTERARNDVATHENRAPATEVSDT